MTEPSWGAGWEETIQQWLELRRRRERRERRRGSRRRVTVIRPARGSAGRMSVLLTLVRSVRRGAR